MILVVATILVALPHSAFAQSNSPQLRTDHPWYPGELSCSSFDRLFATQAALYRRVTGREVKTDEDKALASWYWRNLNYYHGEDASMNYWGDGYAKGGKNHEYWTGLFAYGFGLCGTTHAQWVAELDTLLGPCRSRVTGVSGHNSFEVWLTGGAYGNGKWALLDHDICTVVFNEDGSRLLSIPEIAKDLKKLTNANFKPERQHGWLIGGLHRSDPSAYDQFASAEYRAGYAGPPPLFHLRAGESLRRYLKPGLDDGKTFVYWGLNYMTDGIPGPERSLTWVNQPEKMFNSKQPSPYHAGQARYSNAVYTYKPDFANGSYKEAVIDESDKHVTFEFYTPFVIGCTPANPTKKGFAVYDLGAKNGLVLMGNATCPANISVDQGATWQAVGSCKDGLDLTDFVKGFQQYRIRFDAGAKQLAGTGLSMRTVCQCNACLVPHLKDDGTKVTFSSPGYGVVSAGPTKAQAQAHVVAGKFDSNTVTLELATPRHEKAVRLCAAGWQASSSPPTPAKYFIDCSIDGGKSWQSVVKDWEIIRRPPDPADFWSQSISWGDVELKNVTGPVRVRFRNTGGKNYRRAEAHLVYDVAQPGETEVTFAWREGGGAIRTARHVFANTKEDTSWSIPTGKNVETTWVEYKPR
ncbi:MAG TPA: hypothetical protein VKS79_00085 [Gemmataceae bacterium]|nr:hypothetical protein [Gemmataceae bacterium]